MAITGGRCRRRKSPLAAWADVGSGSTRLPSGFPLAGASLLRGRCLSLHRLFWMRIRFTASRFGSRVSGLASRVSRLGSRVSGLGSRISALASRVSHLASRVSGLGSRVSDLGSRISALGSRVSRLVQQLSAVFWILIHICHDAQLSNLTDSYLNVCPRDCVSRPSTIYLVRYTDRLRIEIGI